MELDLWIGPEDGSSPTLQVRERGNQVRIGTTEEGIAALPDRADVKRLYLTLKYWYDLGEDN